MVENLIFVCYSIFSACIVVALLNVYWSELMKSPRSVYEWVRRFFNIDTPREREWSLIKTGSVSLLFIAVYIILFCFFSETVSKFPDSLVALIVAFPIAWILWVWRNQDKQRTIEFEELSENTRKLLLLGETITNPATSEPVQRTAFWGLVPFLGNVKNLDFFQQTLHFINAYYRFVYDERKKLNDLESPVKEDQKKAECLKERSESYLEIIYYGLKTMNARVDKIGPLALREMEIECNIGTILTDEFASWNFEKSGISNWSITRRTFSFCSFNSAYFVSQCEFNNCKFIECDFSDTHLFQSKFINCSFLNCNFSEINWEETLFQNCLLEGAVSGIHQCDLADPKIPQGVQEMLTAYRKKNDLPLTLMEAIKKLQSPTDEQR